LQKEFRVSVHATMWRLEKILKKNSIEKIIFLWKKICKKNYHTSWCE